MWLWCEAKWTCQHSAELNLPFSPKLQVSPPGTDPVTHSPKQVDASCGQVSSENGDESPEPCMPTFSS